MANITGFITLTNFVIIKTWNK